MRFSGLGSGILRSIRCNFRIGVVFGDRVHKILLFIG